MPEPRTLGRVDWMPRKKVWRVIWYKSATDIPAGDYPTRKEAENALRELVARGNPTPVTPEVTKPKTVLQGIRLYQQQLSEEPSISKYYLRWDKPGYKSGDKFPPSRKWIERKGEPVPTKIQYKGTSVIDPNQKFTPYDYYNLEAIYEGTPYLVKGKYIRKGFDTGEVIIKDAEVVRELVPRPEPAIPTPEELAKLRQLEVAIPKAEVGNPGFTAKEAKSIGEKLGKGETLNNLMPMMPEEGPPLPRGLGLKWPWKK